MEECLWNFYQVLDTITGPQDTEVIKPVTTPDLRDLTVCGERGGERWMGIK